MDTRPGMMHRWSAPLQRRPVLLFVLAAVIAASASLAVAKLHARAVREAADSVALVWHGSDGAAFHFTVTPSALATFETDRDAWMRDEQRQLAALADAIVDHRLAGLYGAMAGNVVEYAGWAYGWLQSYVITYRAALDSAHRVLFPPVGTERSGIGAAFEAAIAAIAVEEFSAVVVQPERAAQVLAATIRDVDGILAAEWTRIVAAERAGFEAFLLRSGVVTHVRADGTRNAPACGDGTMMGTTAAEPIRVPGDIGQDDVLRWRMSRPAAFVALRLAIAGPTAASGTLLIVTALSGSASAAGTAALSASLWAADYAASRLDAALFRADFEARLLTAINTARREHQAAISRNLHAGLSVLFQDLRHCRDRPAVMAAR